MKKSLKNQHKLRSFLIAFCLLISASSFSKELDLMLNTIDLQTVTPTISSFSPLEGYAGSTVTIEGVDFSNTPVVTLNEVDISSSITSKSDTRIVVTLPCNVTSGFFKVDGVASATQFLFKPPVLNNPLTSIVCSGIPIAYQATSSDNSTVLKWLRRAVIGITPAPSLIQSANGNINETLVNSTNAPIDVYYDYELTLNGCSNTQSVIVKVNPTPKLSSTLTPTSICSGATFSYTPNFTITGTTFSWSRAAQSGISELSSSGSASISEFLTNTTNASVGVDYILSLTSPSGCTFAETVRVNVNPLPSVMGSITGDKIVCSGSQESYNVDAISNATSYRWTLPDGSITNTTSTTLLIDYSVVTNSGNLSVVGVNTCGVGVAKTEAITLLSPPVLSSSLTSTVCSGSPFVYTGQVVDNSTDLSWTRAVVPGISNASASSTTGGISETLVNTTNAAIEVVYIYTLTLNGCSNTQSVTVTVNPNDILLNPPTAVEICSGAIFNFVPITSISTSVFSWSRGTVNVTAPIINETLINDGNSSVNLTYNYNLTTLEGCVSPARSFTVKVNPVPKLISIPQTSFCTPLNAPIIFQYTPQTNFAGVVVSWSRAFNSEILEPASSGSGPISESLTSTSTTNTVYANYTFVLEDTDNGCDVTQSFSVTLDKMPDGKPVITGNQTVCAGTRNNVYTATTVANSVSYVWTLPNGSSLTTSSPVISLDFSLSTASGFLNVKGVNSCGDSTISDNFSITVIAPPTLTNSLTSPICSGANFRYDPYSADAGTTFSWIRTDPTDNTIVISSGTGSINETLINNTNVPISVSYKYILATPGGCENTQYVTVIVNPTPNLNLPTINEVACSGNGYSYMPSFSLSGSTHTWTRVPIEGITPFLPSGGGGAGTISEILTNATASTIEVTYQITATVGGCNKTSELKVQVEPRPAAAGPITGPTSICEGDIDKEYSVALIPNATSYEWTLPTGVVITSGLNSNRIIVSFGSGALLGNITVKGVNSCGGGTVFSLPINVYQNATVNLVSGIPNTTLCIGSSFVTPIKYTITPSTEVLKLTGILPAGVTFTPSTGIITGTPTESGSFPFTITSSSNCSNSLSGIIVVNPLQSITKLSGVANQVACINTPIDPIVYSIPTGITGVIINPALPLGIVATVDVVNGFVLISGTPTVATSLAQNYIIETQGSCGSTVRAIISFDIKPAVILDFLSSTASLNQAVCLNGPIEPIRFSIGGGATGIIQPVLPAGLTFSFDLVSGVYTIQGNPTANGTFTIPITTTGCNKTEIITISNVNTAVSIDLKSALGTDQQTLCQSNFNSPILPIQYSMVGATSVQVVGLPAGVNFVYNSTTSELVISGTPTQTGIFNYTITSLPCSIIKTGVLKVSIPMFISSESIKNVSCSTASNGEIAITIIGGVPIAGQYAVKWTGPNNFQQNRLNITGLQAGEYTLTGSDAVGCLLPSKKYTVLPVSPILISLISTTNVTCTTSLGCANLSFTGGTGTYTSFNLQYLDSSLQMWATVPNPSNNYFNICNLKAGLYRISVTDSNSCTTEPFQFSIYDYSMLKIDAVNLDNAVCINTSGKVRVTVSSLDHNLTFFYNGILVPSVDLGNNKYELSIASPTAPSGIVKVTNSQNCWDTKTINININEPKIDVSSTNLTTYGLISVNESVKFTNGLAVANIPAEYDYIVWDFGDYSPQKVFDNPTEILPNALGESITTVFHSFAKDGLYPVTLTAYNQFGCSISITEIVTVGQGASIMTPSAFSPNGDGINDLFRPSLLGLKEVSMYIYDNWGNLVYEFTSDVASLPSDWGWNGIEKVNSEPVNGTYRFYISAITINDSTIEKDGQFILIK